MNHPVAYASLDRFATYLSDAGRKGNVLADADTLLLALESASKRMETHLGGRTFGPVLQTRAYQTYLHSWGSGAGRSGIVVGPQNNYGGGTGPFLGGGGGGMSDALLARGAGWSDWLWPEGAAGGAELELNAWLLSVSSVSLVRADGSLTQTLTNGPTADYELVGANLGPATSLRLTQTRASSLAASAYLLMVTGFWGYEDRRRQLSTLAADLTDTATIITVQDADAGAFSAGQTLWLDAEQVYVSTESSSAALTVERGINGTTPAAHASGTPVQLVRYHAEAEWTCLEMARSRYRNREMGPGNTVGTPDQGVAVGTIREDQYLARLDEILFPREAGAPAYGVA